jgi:hypothetical protein
MVLMKLIVIHLKNQICLDIIFEYFGFEIIFEYFGFEIIFEYFGFEIIFETIFEILFLLFK